jgi:predicted enzyme related to lactoylglutathione lyase
MRIGHGLLLAAAMVVSEQAMSAPAPAAVAEPLKLQRFGLYVLADDLDRSTLFYERLFGKAPQVRTAGMTGFDLAGGLFAVVSARDYAPGARRGDSTVPYLKVADVDRLFAHVQRIAPDRLIGKQPVSEGPFRFFRMRDSENNLLEFFQLSPGQN